jgi:hypothetical protein
MKMKMMALRADKLRPVPGAAAHTRRSRGQRRPSGIIFVGR